MTNSRSLLLIVILCCSSTMYSQDLSMYLKKTFSSPEGTQLPYRILLPENYDKEKKYPLILVLHGSGERGNDNEKQLVHGSKLFLDPVVRKTYPAIVVFPQCPQESSWSSLTSDRSKTPPTRVFDYTKPVNPPLKDAMSLVRRLMEDEAVDAKRVYIAGLSMGGMGTFEAVYRYPELFAAALPICGGGDTLHYEKVKTAFWIFHGADDAVVDVKCSRTMVEKLKDLKVKVQYTEYPGVNHNSWDSAFAEKDFLKWTFRQKAKGK